MVQDKGKKKCDLKINVQWYQDINKYKTLQKTMYYYNIMNDSTFNICRNIGDKKLHICEKHSQKTIQYDRDYNLVCKKYRISLCHGVNKRRIDKLMRQF